MPLDSQNNADWFSGTISPLFTSVTRLTFPSTEGSATGFYYNKSGNTYLVTNRHVVRDEQEGHEPNEITYYIRDYGNLENLNSITIPLDKNDTWYPHPSESSVDVAVIAIDQVLDGMENGGTTGSRAIPEDLLIRNQSGLEYGLLETGHQVLSIGYPGLFRDRTADLPVARKGTISSQYGIRFDGDPLFVVDARMHNGTSGSPVFLNPNTILHSLTGEYDSRYGVLALLGIHSTTYKQPSEGDSESRLDLNGVWYAELVDEIVESIQ